MATSTNDNVPVGKIVGIAIFAVIGLILLFGSWYSVDAGEKAVVLRFGAIAAETGEGIHGKMPLIDRVVYFESRVLKSNVNAAAYSKDAQVIDMNLSINYRIGKSASEIYSNLGEDYANRVISPAIQDSVKKVIAQYDAQTLLDNYANASRDISAVLESKLEPFGIDVVGVNIVNHDYSSAFEAAVEAKQLAIQSALKAENDLRTIRVQAEQTITQQNASAQAKILQGQAEASAQLALAEANARSKLLLAQAEAESLRLQKAEITSTLLELRQIEVQKEYASHWNGQLPKIIMGGSQIPLVQFPAGIIDEATSK